MSVRNNNSGNYEAHMEYYGMQVDKSNSGSDEGNNGNGNDDSGDRRRNGCSASVVGNNDGSFAARCEDQLMDLEQEDMESILDITDDCEEQCGNEAGISQNGNEGNMKYMKRVPRQVEWKMRERHLCHWKCCEPREKRTVLLTMETRRLERKMRGER